MSLLLDALKRAEQEKLARQGEASNDATPQAAATAAPKPAASLELQPLGGAQAAPQASAGASAREEPAHAAQVLFDAKAPPAEAKRSRGMLWATVAVIAVVVASAMAYVWYQIRILSPAPAPALARRPPPLPLPPPSTGAPPPVAPIEVAPRAATVTVAAEPAPRTPSGLPPQPQAPVAAPRQEEDAVTRMLREAPASSPPPLKLERALERPPIAPDVSAGYSALRGGDLTEARRRYQAALANDERNLDAQLGLATVEARAGNRTVALAHYRRVLELDSRNATALAGVAALLEGQAPESVEGQLRENVARLPDSAALRFTLGAHYAAQRRWGEAQAAFYEAHRLDPGNADILFNLAVSLDHLNQPRLAADFYRRAAESAQSQPTQFDPAAARRRLAEIAAR